MTFILLYAGQDSEKVAASYLSARNSLSVNDRRNIEAVWSAGLDTYNTAPLVWNGGPVGDPASWDALCIQQPAGTIDTGLCDTVTRKITVTGVWDRNVAAYGAAANQPIQLGALTGNNVGTGFVGLLHFLANVDPDAVRADAIHTLANDMADTGIQQ